jgi:hypothetical protein
MSEQTGRGRNLRLLLLVAVLILMVFALWYEYKVARPSVLAANEKIVALNEEINRDGNTTAMTNKDVQEALNRQPSRTYQDGQYTVEVYSWVSGLPFRTHDWYAFYTSNSGQLLFSFCHAFEVPPGGLAVESTPAQDTGDEELEGEDAEHEMSGGPTKKGRGGDAERRPGDEEAEGEQEEMAAEADGSESAEPPTDEPPTDEPPTDEAAEAAPAPEDGETEQSEPESGPAAASEPQEAVAPADTPTKPPQEPTPPADAGGEATKDAPASTDSQDP